MGKTNLEKEAEFLGPLPENPFKVYRQRAGLSLLQVANQAHMAKNSIIKAEQGTPANPYPRLTEFWLNHPKGPESELEIVRDYEQFQWDMRQRHIHYFGPSPYFTVQPLHPFRQLRNHKHFTYNDSYGPVGIKQVARDLCLPEDTLMYFERKWRKQRSTPKLVMYVLDLIGYDADSFDQNYKTWREVHNVYLTKEVASSNG